MRKKVMIVIAAVWVGIMFIDALHQAKTGENRCKPIDAYVKFTILAEGFFKSPSTVDFASYTPDKVFSEDCINYNIRTHADAQNSFGATVRSAVMGKLQLDGKGAKLVDINIF